MTSDYRRECGAGLQPNAEGRTVVVTGAAGFIGSHLVDALLDQGCLVTGIDNFDPWYEPAQKLRNISAATTNPRYRHLDLDLVTGGLFDLRAALRSADVVYHLAGRPGVQDSWGDGFRETCEQNILMSQRLFEAAAAEEVGRMVVASSSSVYGSSASSPDRTVAPISPYGISKAAVEQLATVYHDRGLPIVSLRYFSVYGPRQRPDMAFHRLFDACLDGPPFPRRGPGHQRREFTYVGDVAAATIRAGQVPSAHVVGQTFDIGGGCITSLNQVIEGIGRLTGRSPRMTPEEAKPGDPPLTTADAETTKHALGWAAGVPLELGLQHQWRWHRDAAEAHGDAAQADRAAGRAVAV